MAGSTVPPLCPAAAADRWAAASPPVRAAAPSVWDNKERLLGMETSLGLSVAGTLVAVDVKDLGGHERHRLEVQDGSPIPETSPMCPTGWRAPSALGPSPM